MSDEWRLRRNNLDKKKDRWIGKTVFFAHGKAQKEWKPNDEAGVGHVWLCVGERALSGLLL